MASELEDLLREARRGRLDPWLVDWSGSPEANAVYQSVRAWFKGGELPDREAFAQLADHDRHEIALNIARWLALENERAPALMAHLQPTGWVLLLEEAMLASSKQEWTLQVARTLWDKARSIEAHEVLTRLADQGVPGAREALGA